MAAFQRHLSGETPFYKAEFRIRRKDGAYAWRLTQAKVLTRDDQGKPVRVVGTQIDISERKRSERDLEDLVQARTSELEVAKVAAEAANRAKSLFLANMSHELRTPMHAVLAYARLGLERTPDAKVQSFMTRIVENADRLLLLLNDLLDLSKLEAGKMQLRLESYDVEQLVREVASELEPLMTSKGLVLAYEREGTCQSSSALVDRSRMAQLFRNILANAVRFSAPGGRIVVRFACADARSLPEHAGATAESALEVAISDQGVGIPEGELEHIFDSFVQSSTTHASAGGTGLGLAICRQIAGLHQGTVHARKQTGVGATFVVTLPSERRVESHAREVA
jgi:signal transduction histidine kinase